MSNVRDYLKEREKRQNSTQNIDYKERIRSHRLTIFYRIVLMVLLIGALTAFLAIQWKNKIFTDSVVTMSAPVVIAGGTHIENLGENVLLYSKDGASCMDSKGNVVWNRAFEMQTPMISICGQTAAIGDYNGRTIYVMDKNGEKGTVSTNLPIRKFCVSENYVVATVLDDAEVTRIYVYNGQENTKKPIVQSKVTMDKSGYPVDISLSPNGKIMAVSYLYVDNGQMKSSIAFYNFGEVGQNEIDNYVSGFDYLDTIIPEVQFMDSDSAFAVSDDRIVFFSGAEKPANVATTLIEEEVQGIYYNESYVGLVFRNSTGETAYRLDVYGASGNKVHSQLFDMDYTDIIFCKEQIIIYNDLDCQICNMNGTDRFTGGFEKGTLLVIPTSSIYKYITVTNNSLDTIELK